MSRDNKKFSLARSLNCCHQQGNKTNKISMKRSLNKKSTFVVLIRIVALNVCLTSLQDKVALVNMSELKIYGTTTTTTTSTSIAEVKVEAETRQADVTLLSTNITSTNTENALEFAVKQNFQTETTTQQTALLGETNLAGSAASSGAIITSTTPERPLELNDVTWTTTITQPTDTVSTSTNEIHNNDDSNRQNDQDDDNIVISSSEIVSDNGRNNYISNSSMKQREINLVNLNNCYSKKNKTKDNDLVESIYAELDIKRSTSNGDDDENSYGEESSYINVVNSSTHYSNSRHILRILVVGLFGLVCLSLTIVYAIKFCVCRKRKLRHDITGFGGSCSLTRRNFVIDLDHQISESNSNYIAHSACPCSCSALANNSNQPIEIPQSATITPQLNRFQSLFKSDFLSKNYRISDSSSAKTGPNLSSSQIGYLNNHQALLTSGDDETIANNRGESSLGCNLLPVQNQSLILSSNSSSNNNNNNNSCQQHLPNFDRLYNYHYCHHNHQFNIASSSSLMPLLTSCPCLSNTNQYNSASQTITLQLDSIANASRSTTTAAAALETSQQASQNEQIDSQQKPPTYYELFGGEQSQQETVGNSQVIGGATSPVQNEPTDNASLVTANPSSSSVDRQSSSTIDQQQQQQQDRKNLLVKLNLNKTKLLSAGDLMLLSKLIDVPIVVQQQQQQQQLEDRQSPSQQE